MTQLLLKSRLFQSAQSAPEQMQPDFETQFEEFKAIVHSVLYSESGYLAIAQSLDEALGLLEESLPSKKKNVACSPASFSTLVREFSRTLDLRYDTDCHNGAGDFHRVCPVRIISPPGALTFRIYFALSVCLLRSTSRQLS